MQRRDFLTKSGVGLLGAIALDPRQLCAGTANVTGSGIAWQRNCRTGLFQEINADGQPLVRGKKTEAGLLDGYCRPSGNAPGVGATATAASPSAHCGPVGIELTHRLLASEGVGKEDLLEAALTLHNSADRPQTVDVGFQSSARPCVRTMDQQVYVPISAGGLFRDQRLAELGSLQWPEDCRQPMRADGFLCHYLEPLASDPRQPATPALLLAPVVDVFCNEQPWRVALFSTSTEPTYFQASVKDEGAWQMGRSLRLDPGQRLTIRGYLHVHRGDAGEAWAAFHRYGHREDYPAIPWLREIRVHYYDFLSAAEPNGRRGNGYETDLPLFDAFHVGMATQHGYYLSMGDYLHPDRKQWQAMATDPAGAVTMTLEKMKARIEATRRAGAHPAVYLHTSVLDEGSPLFAQMKDSVVIDPQGNPMPFGWRGPDVIKRCWNMSVASPAWRDHLLHQARWIMELLNPDAIVMDETFMAMGYDHHPQRQGPLSSGGIDLMRKLRALLRSFGPNKAFLTSDCSMSNMVMWADGEAGDHAYKLLLGHPLYRQSPVRYLSALGAKPWRSCAWDFQNMWPIQMELARSIGAGVGVSNGWIQFTGLTRLPATVHQQMVQDIESLLGQGR